jgi:hypothetical protein
MLPYNAEQHQRGDKILRYQMTWRRIFNTGIAVHATCKGSGGISFYHFRK